MNTQPVGSPKTPIESAAEQIDRLDDTIASLYVSVSRVSEMLVGPVSPRVDIPKEPTNCSGFWGTLETRLATLADRVAATEQLVNRLI